MAISRNAFNSSTEWNAVRRGGKMQERESKIERELVKLKEKRIKEGGKERKERECVRKRINKQN